MTKQEAIESVKNSMGSLFTREDVVRMLEGITEDQGPAVDGAGFTPEDRTFLDPTFAQAATAEHDFIMIKREKLIDRVDEIIKEVLNEDLKDRCDVELSLDWDNHVNVDNVSINLSVISDEVSTALENWISEEYPETDYKTK